MDADKPEKSTTCGNVQADSEIPEDSSETEVKNTTDTNTPASIIVDITAESDTTPVPVPSTLEKSALEEDNAADMETSTDIKSEEIKQPDIENTTKENPDEPHGPDAAATTSGEKKEATIISNKQSKEATENVLETTLVTNLKTTESEDNNTIQNPPNTQEEQEDPVHMETDKPVISTEEKGLSEEVISSPVEPTCENSTKEICITPEEKVTKDSNEAESLEKKEITSEQVQIVGEKISETSDQDESMEDMPATETKIQSKENIGTSTDKPNQTSSSTKIAEKEENVDTNHKPLDTREKLDAAKENCSSDNNLEQVPSNPEDMLEKIVEGTKETESKLSDAAEDMPQESVEIMDTCDSQESTNLVIDETPDTSGNGDGTSEEMSKDVANVDTSDKAAEHSNNEDTNKTEEKDTDDDGKDDDVIPIEQPPMPVIEIDDDDDEDEEPSSIKTPIKDKESEVKAMELEEDMPKDTNDESVTPMDISSEKETDNPNNSDLLTVALEKSMEEVLKEDENCENKEDTTVEVFYNKECINYECPHKHKQYFRVPHFAFSYFKVNKKKFKMQYICADCYDKALEMFEEYCGLINAKQPLLMENIPSGRQEFVEIIDSSDEEDGLDSSKIFEPTESAFSTNDLSLIERELHNTIKSVLERVEIQNQLTWSKTILSERLKRLEMETEYVDNELRSLQRKADKMHEGLYSCPKIKIRQLQPLDLNSGKIMGFETPQPEVQPIPPVGEIERPAIVNNGAYFAVKNNAIASWVPCKVLDQVEGGLAAQKNLKYYRIKFLKIQHQMLKTVPAKYLAYYEPPTVRLPIGTRVIAYFDATSLARGREKMNVQSAFYPGIIAEPLKPNNKFRYLIFYDDGYTQYVYHKDVRLVCHVSENVWEDVHPASRDFIQKYLTQYSINRPMVQTQKGQSMNTESNGYWLHARVVDIDCSLVLMQFEGSKSHTEWIYRGSLRLGPVFKEYQKTLQKSSNIPVSRLPRRTEPFIRYTEDEESSSSQQQQAEKSTEGNRAVARKSFGRPESMMNSAQPSASLQKEHAANVPTVKHLNNSTIYVEDENKPKGKVVYYTAKRNLPPRKYSPHVCSPRCLFEITHNLSAYSPLSKPLLSGWERFIIRQKIKKVVTYRAPCGKIFRNMKELHHYLRVTCNTLNVDNFDFSPDTNCLAEYVIESAIIQKRDISCGQEKMAIPLVNYYDNTLPPECKYSAKVIPTEGVHINKDPEFFAGCDCDDDCSDKSKCSCWQLTIAGAKYGNPNTPIEEVGYQYKRLLEHVPTGIYECNPRCKCKQNCLNRVVQHSLQLKLQVFKTSNRGWGLRCINDVPRGTFVCVYAGHLLTEAKANEGGQDAGDEYFAELDYIEVAEQIKEGYESEVEPHEPEDEDTYQPEQDDDDFTPSKSFLTRAKRQSATKSTRPANQEDESQERQVINFNPNADMNEDSVRENSIRKLYGKDEACYVMDAKISGNLGRYFNHSCAPNMFVQNVFVDTHDLRFPWVAFFASCNIRAGTELTWNYNYEVGVVPGKVLYCQCGAPTCRLRLL